MSLIMHPETVATRRLLAENLPHATLLTGKPGVGLGSLAREVAKSYSLAYVVQPQLLTKASTSAQIGIGAIRELYEATRSKNQHDAVYIIDDADAMTLPAQNSFLKLLEEPGIRYHFILTAHYPEKLLPTLRSRCQSFYLKPVSDAKAKQFLGSFPGLPETKQKQIIFIANGLPAEIYRLATNEAYFSRVAQRTSLARRLLEASPYERLAMLSVEKVERQEALELCKTMLKLLELKPTDDGLRTITALLQAYDAIQANGNVKLQLANAMV